MARKSEAIPSTRSVQVWLRLSRGGPSPRPRGAEGLLAGGPLRVPEALKGPLAEAAVVAAAAPTTHMLPAPPPTGGEGWGGVAVAQGSIRLMQPILKLLLRGSS